MKEWYYVSSNKEPIGPLEVEEMKDLLQRGILNKDSMVWKNGLEDWIALKDTELMLEQSTNSVPPIPPTMEQTVNNRPMKWYKFETYFLLLFEAVLCIGLAIVYLTGMQYSVQDVNPSLVYSYYPAIHIIDIVFGILSIGFALAYVYFFIIMKKMKKDAWIFYLIFIGIYGVVNFIYTFSCNIVIGSNDFYSAISPIISAAIGISLRYIYYRKRADLFKN